MKIMLAVFCLLSTVYAHGALYSYLVKSEDFDNALTLDEKSTYTENKAGTYGLYRVTLDKQKDFDGMQLVEKLQIATKYSIRHGGIITEVAHERYSDDYDIHFSTI